MSLTEFSCPACRALVQYRKPLLAGKRLVCPYCESRFSLPMELAKLPSARGHIERRSGVAVGQVSSLPPQTETNPRVARPERREGREEPQIISTPFEDSGRATQRSLPSSSFPPSVSPQIDPGGSPDLRKIYRRFAFILIATILILSAGFGAALYFVMKNRPMSVPVAELVPQPEQ